MTGWTGFWILSPLAGWFVWTIKTQGALNRYWETRQGRAKGQAAADSAQPPGVVAGVREAFAVGANEVLLVGAAGKGVRRGTASQGEAWHRSSSTRSRRYTQTARRLSTP